MLSLGVVKTWTLNAHRMSILDILEDTHRSSVIDADWPSTVFVQHVKKSH